MANTYDIIKHTTLGDLKLTVTEALGDGSTTSIAASDLGLEYVLFVWSVDVDDDDLLSFSTYSGSTLTLGAAISSGKYQLIFAAGW